MTHSLTQKRIKPMKTFYKYAAFAAAALAGLCACSSDDDAAETGSGLQPVAQPQIIVSDTPCMREVYGPCAAYIDLTANPGDVDDVTPATAPTAALLEKYSWDKSAERLLQILAK